MEFASFIFMPTFPLVRVAEATALRLGIPHGQQQFQVILLAPLHTTETLHKLTDVFYSLTVL